MTRLFPLAALMIAAPAFAASPIEGQWTNPTRDVTVRIVPCGKRTWCGRVVSASPEARAQAAAGGTAPLVGATLMRDLVPADGGGWQGEFFIPDRNLRATGALRLVGSKTIEIEGCAVPGILCRTQRWTRVSARVRRGR